MSHDHDDPSLTACGLGESPEAGGELDASERVRIERTAGLAREVLRATDVAGLDAAMRGQIAARAAQRSQPRTWPLLLAATLGGAFVVALALYLGVVRPAEERAVLAERALAERAQAEQAQFEQRVRQLELERAQAQHLAEQAAHVSEAASMEADRVQEAVPARSVGRPHAARRPASGASSSSAGGCDPNDALCGL